jgi:hypothetical protein
MVVYHNIYLQWTVIIASSYKGWLPQHLLKMDGYKSIYTQWMVTIISTYNVIIPSTYKRWLP